MHTFTYISGLLCLLGVITLVAAYPSFPERIPNGERVPHPCKPNYLWKGVGHKNQLGGGPRNAFGLDFKANDLVWNRTLCMKDSDGDDKTNGQELGDPDCIWTPGNTPKTTLGLSHPGICDPFDGPLCSGRPDFVDCGLVDFDCPAIKEPRTFNVTIKLPKTDVPAKETTYMCMNFALPSDQEYHMVATMPAIDEINVMHHILVYGCSVSNASELASPLDFPYDCGMSADRKCQDVIGIWSVGVAGNCLHKKAGFLVGGSQGYRYAAYQIHWNNPQLKADYKDGSGMTFYLTPQLRPNNAGILLIGQEHLEIPANRQAVVATGSCLPECTRELPASIYVTAGFNHMHYLGAAQLTELRRNGDHVTYLAEDNHYRFDLPVFYDHENEVEIKPGDELQTTCVFKSTSRSTTTFYGESTSEEMCYSFLTYYPKENLPVKECTQTRSISSCDRDDNIIQGCDTSILANISHPVMSKLIENLYSKCKSAYCTLACLDYIRQAKKEFPCLTGDIHIELREYTEYYMYGQTKADSLDFWARIGSCDVELAREACARGGTDRASLLAPITFLLTMGALTPFLIG